MTERTKNRSTDGYSKFAIGGVLGSTDQPRLMVTESLYLRMSIYNKKPAHRKSA